MRTFLIVIGTIVWMLPALGDDATAPVDRVMATRVQTSYPMSGATAQDLMTLRAAKSAFCGEQFRIRKIKTATSSAHCVYDGFTQAMDAIGAPADLITALVEREFAIADQYDRKKISLAEVNAASAEALAHMGTEAQLRYQALLEQERLQQQQLAAIDQQEVEQRRLQQKALADAAAQERHLRLCMVAGMSQPAPTIGDSIGNSLRAKAYCEAGLPPPIPQPAPTYQAPVLTTTNCVRMGSGISCTTQ